MIENNQTLRLNRDRYDAECDNQTAQLSIQTLLNLGVLEIETLPEQEGFTSLRLSDRDVAKLGHALEQLDKDVGYTTVDICNRSRTIRHLVREFGIVTTNEVISVFGWGFVKNDGIKGFKLRFLG